MNQPTAGEVELAVRAVLANLARAHAPAAAQPAVVPSAQVFPGRLLGVREAQSLAEQVQAVCVSPGTVITPLARDYLKQRGVAVQWGNPGPTAATGTWGLVVESETAHSQAVQRTLLTGSSPWQALGACPLAGARWAAESADRAALILSGSGALTCWKAGRAPGVRAAVAFDVMALQRTLEDLGPNVLVIEPQGGSLALILQLAEIYRRNGAPRVPAAVKSLIQERSDADRGSDWTRHALKATPEPAAWPAVHYPAPPARGASIGFTATG